MTTLKVHHGAWVLVGDGKKALFLNNEGDAELLNLRRISVREQVNPATHLQGTDAPGRGSAPSGIRHGAMGETDWHQIEEDHFAATLAGEVNKAASENGFKEIVIVAPPKCLAEIRRDLSPDAKRRVVAEIPKDYTHHPIPEIEKLLAAHAIG